MQAIRRAATHTIQAEFWRRFDEGLISEQDVLYQLEVTGYPEEVLAPLKAYCAQPVVTRNRLFAWLWGAGGIKEKAGLC